MVSALILMVSTLVLVVTATLILIVALVGTASCLRSSLMLQNTTLGISKWGLRAKLFYLIVTARSVLGIPSFPRSGPELLLLLTSRWLDWFHMSSVTVLHKPVFRTIISSQLLKKLTLCWAVPAWVPWSTDIDLREPSDAGVVLRLAAPPINSKTESNLRPLEFF